MPFADWIKATIGFSIPVAANVAEVVRGAILSVHKVSGTLPSDRSFKEAVSYAGDFATMHKADDRSLDELVRRLALATPVASILGVREAVGSAQQ